MGLSIVAGEIAEFDSCVRKELLTYVRYPEGSGSRCFAYPRYLYADDALNRLAESAFPDEGCLPMAIAGTTKAELSKKYGPIVVMRVNHEELRENLNYPGTELSRYNGVINPTLPRGRSAVEFLEFSKHALSSSMMQIIEVDEMLDFNHALNDPVHLAYGLLAPQTKLILVSQRTDGKEKVFGPFEYMYESEGVLRIRASESYEKFIAGFEMSSFKVEVALDDEAGDVAARFADAEEFRGKFDGTSKRYDWVSDDELIDAIGRVSKTGDEALSKSMMRLLKTKLKTCLDADARIKLTSDRRDRMIGLLNTHENWSSLPDEVKGDAIANADPDALADFVLSSDSFKPFYEKVMENDNVRSKVEIEKARYMAAVESSKKAADDANARLTDVKAELEEFEEELASRRAKLEDEVALATELAREERDKLLDEVEKLKGEHKKLNEDKILVQRQIRKTIDDMSDELSVSSKILENEMIKQIVTSINTSEPTSDEEGIDEGCEQAPCAIALRADEDTMSGQEVIAEIESSICVDAGRELTRNEIVNLLICLIQGYITTLAGLPGTGKTSLASILAGSLGLTSPEVERFEEVSVEKGWTSYKDFIGYYNPFTMQMEKSNAAVFEAFSMLDKEARSGIDAGDAAPFIFVLDEANLSSVEHYWSPFLRACDSFDNRPTELFLGGEGPMLVPSYARFIATVNFDHTTEELSPRFLDRSWVITLDPEPIDFGGEIVSGAIPDFSEVKPVSFKKLNEVFGARKQAMLDAELSSKYREVADLFSKHHFPISNRSQLMIQRYACTAFDLMDRSSAQTAFAPIDYAVSQKLLPLISGVDEKIGGLLRDLDNVGGLPVMKRRVERMLEVGEDSGFFQYFA